MELEKKDLKVKALTLVVESIDLQKLAKGLVSEILDEALDDLVNDTKNPYDNVVKASLYPVLEAKLIEAIDKNLDLKKILGL